MVTLHPDRNGVVHIVTKSGNTQCEVSKESVICKAEFANSPVINGRHANEVKVATGGRLQWILGNIGAQPDNFTMGHQTYQAQGWTIVATSAGTRFTNDRSGHGMFVSIDTVQVF